MTTMTAPRPTSTPSATYDLMISARRSLTEAHRCANASERYVAAHLAALRAAAAVLAARTHPDGRRRQVRSVWSILPVAAPELTEWAEFFAIGARKRAIAEAGIPCVGMREADDLMRDAGIFIGRAAVLLGLAA